MKSSSFLLWYYRVMFQKKRHVMRWIFQNQYPFKCQMHARDSPDFSQSNHDEGANNENVNCLAFIAGTDYTNE